METVEQIDPTDSLTVEDVQKKVVKGAAILTGRTVLMQIVSFTSTALLTVFLTPANFGVFFLVSAIKNFLGYFGDIGFAASLIQKKESLTRDELKTVFTVQQFLVLTLIILVFLLTPLIKSIFGLEGDAVYLLWAVSFSLFLSSLKTIPTVLLERRLDFNKWVIPQIIETLAFNLTAVFLAYKGMGITSFTVAVLLSGVLGLVAAYIVQPWLPGISFSMSSFKSIMKFGIPYQVNTLLAMVKDDGMTLFLGGILGTSGIGLLGWAQKWAYAPLRFFMDQVIKVTFPAFSRLQDKKEELSVIVSKSIFFITFLVLPSLVFLNLSAPTLVEIIPKYKKWEGALFALYLLTITSALAAVTTPLTNALNAIGKISVTFKLMIMWTVLTWVLVPYLALKYGLNGAALGFSLVGTTSLLALYIVSKYIKVNFLKNVGKPLLASVLMAGVLIFVKLQIDTSLLQVIVMAIAGFISYILFMMILEPKILKLVKKLFTLKKDRKK